MIAHFSLRLICGMSAMWCLMPRSQVTGRVPVCSDASEKKGQFSTGLTASEQSASQVPAGFFRIQMLIVLGLSVLAALTTGDVRFPSSGESALPASVGPWACGGLAGVSFLGSVLWTLQRRRAGTVCGFVIAGVSATLLLMRTSIPQGSGRAVENLIPLSELSAAALLGSAVTGMLLGHWYLTAPSMSLAPLKRLNLYFGGAGAVRLVLAAIGLWLAWHQIAAPTHWLWLAMRWAAGILGPLVVFVMVWQILKYRQTQAATGVLFVGVVLTFIGELSASLLYRELSLPL